MHFKYKNKKLMCEGVAVEGLAKKYGTPLYVMSSKSIIDQYTSFEDAFSGIDHLTCYAIKANYNLSIVRLLAKEGAGADVGSSGELFRALTGGINPKKIVMSGVGKTCSDIEYALKSKILMLKAESFSELQQINNIAKKLKVIAPVGIRMNPNVLVDTHANIATGGMEHKFGIDEKFLPEILNFIKKAKNINFVGLDVHVGSQVPDPKSYTQAIQAILKIKQKIENVGHKISYVDIGGGFPVTYDEKKEMKIISHFSREIISALKNCGAVTIFEPGRYLVANAGILVTEVVTVKENSAKKVFAVLDAGMTELMRPALYDAYHNILPVTKHARKVVTMDLVGPVCESTDAFAKGRVISQVKEGEFLAIMSSGAYGSVMGSNYNGRLRPYEVLISDKKVKIIRKKETFDQMIQNEI
jgi:diaminopimelate decarboxylase